MLLLAGPLVAILGVVAIVFVMRHKSVEKRSMYSARRSQIEHKVRAARQRTLTPHGHAPKPAEQPAQAQGMAYQQQAQPTISYQAPAYEAPPVAPPPAPPAREQPAPASMPWETPGSAPEPAPSGWDFPPATTAPPQPAYNPPAYAEPSPAAAEAIPMPSGEPAWTPAPVTPAPAAAAQTVAPAASSTSAGSWSVVSTSKEPAGAAEAGTKGGKKEKKKKKEQAASGSEWSLASGDSAGGLDAAEEPEGRRPSGTIIALAQYAVLVVGLVMVLVGVLVMVANSHVT